MAAASGRSAPALNPGSALTPADLAKEPGSAAARLLAEPFAFDFFQAMRILERMLPDRVPVGRSGPLAREVARLRAHLSLSFPPSAIYDLALDQDPSQAPAMTVTFL